MTLSVTAASTRTPCLTCRGKGTVHHDDRRSEALVDRTCGTCGGTGTVPLPKLSTISEKDKRVAVYTVITGQPFGWVVVYQGKVVSGPELRDVTTALLLAEHMNQAFYVGVKEGSTLVARMVRSTVDTFDKEGVQLRQNVCETCHGTGKKLRQPEGFYDPPCETCHGTGRHP